jgi:hypothetical protein
MSERLSKQQFLDLIAVWNFAHSQALQAGAPGFGSEVTLIDWLGSVEAFARIIGIHSTIAEHLALEKAGQAS